MWCTHHLHHHTGTWLLLQFLRWWHTALSLISTRWSNGSCTDAQAAWRTSRHGWKNIIYSSTWQRLSFLSSLPLQPTAWLQDSVRFINNYPISFGQRNLGVILMISWPFKEHIAKTARSCRFALHTSERSALSDRACCTTSCPGPCHF